MDAISALQDSLRTELELFRARLSSIVIVDVGTIVEVNEGRAVVHGSSFVGGQQTVYQDAEIIFPGNAAGAYTVDAVGATCLIFIPRSNMHDTVSRNIRFGSVPFDTDGVKVLPISNGTQDVVSIMRDAGGTQHISGSNYDVAFSEGAVTVSSNDGTASVALDPNNNLHITKQTDNGTYYKDFEDGTVTETWISKDKDVQWVDTFNSDGSRSLVQSDPRDDQSDPLCSITIDKTGAVSINLTKGITFETKDALTLKGKTVTIESTDGATTMTSSDNINVTSGDGKKFTVNGTNLEVEK